MILALTEDGLLTWPQVGLSALAVLLLLWLAWEGKKLLVELVKRIGKDNES